MVKPLSARTTSPGCILSKNFGDIGTLVALVTLALYSLRSLPSHLLNRSSFWLRTRTCRSRRDLSRSGGLSSRGSTGPSCRTSTWGTACSCSTILRDIPNVIFHLIMDILHVEVQSGRQNVITVMSFWYMILEMTPQSSIMGKFRGPLCSQALPPQTWHGVGWRGVA